MAELVRRHFAGRAEVQYLVLSRQETWTTRGQISSGEADRRAPRESFLVESTGGSPSFSIVVDAYFAPPPSPSSIVDTRAWKVYHWSGQSLVAFTGCDRHGSARRFSCSTAGSLVNGRRFRSASSRLPVPGPSVRIASRIAGCSFSSARFCETTFGATPSSRASSAWVATRPASSICCHSSASCRVRTILGSCFSRGFRCRCAAVGFKNELAVFLLETPLGRHDKAREGFTSKEI
jgi:hypothetical protein